MHVSFLHRTRPFSTAAGSSHLVHLPSSPETAGLSPVGLPPVGLPPVGLPPVGFSISGQPSAGQATHAPSSLLNAKVSSSPFTHLALPEPSTMKPSAHLMIQVSFLHRTKPFSTAAGSSHLVHLPSSPET